MVHFLLDALVGWARSRNESYSTVSENAGTERTARRYEVENNQRVWGIVRSCCCCCCCCSGPSTYLKQKQVSGLHTQEVLRYTILNPLYNLWSREKKKKRA
jgi:hypothetical protein